MERLTISVSEDFAAEVTAFMRRRGYDNRSEAVRDLARIGGPHDDQCFGSSDLSRGRAARHRSTDRRGSPG